MAEFDDLIEVVRNLKNRSTLAGVLSGELVVDTPEKLAALQECEADPENTALTLLDPISIGSVTLGSTVQIQIGTPRPGFGLLSDCIDSLLRFPKAHIKEPPQYYLLDSDYHSRDIAPADHWILSYRAIHAFVVMLRSCAAFLDEEEEVLVFIKEGKFEVPVKYTEEDLRSFNPQALATVSCKIPNGIHEEQCASIMAESVYELTAKLPSHKRFASLLEQAQELQDRFEKGYKLFAAGFSYEKIRDEIEAARVEYAGKIHKVFSDIQNQLLGIPVATVIVATQMKESAKVDANFWISLAVLAGSFVFMLLMHFLLRNQRQTLEVIGLEINRQKGKLEKEHAAIASNLADTFKSLDARYKNQKAVLYFIDWVVVSGFLLSVFFFYKLSQPAQLFLREIIS
jgi:hypothetical protein